MRAPLLSRSHRRRRGGADVVYLVRDDFSVEESAPLASPRIAVPGPGTVTIVDTGNIADIINSKFVISNRTADGDPGIWTVAQTRAAGLVLYNALIMEDDIWVGYDTNPAGELIETGWRNSGGAETLRAFIAGVVPIIGVYDSTLEYQLMNVLRGTGEFLLIKGNAFAEWTLLYVIDTFSTATLYGNVGIDFERAGNTELSTMRVSQLPIPWNTDFGIATDQLTGARSAGDTFTHEADSLIEFVATAIPVGLQIELRFRIVDATPASEDLWQVTIDSNGDIDLDEVVGGGVTQRGTSAAAVANGNRVIIISDDETINVYANNILVITYTSAATYKTATAGELETEGTGGAVDDIVSWPRVLSGSAKIELDRVVSGKK